MAVPVENRVQRLELEVNELRSELDVLRRRNVTLQTRLDDCLALMRGLAQRLPDSFLPDLAESDALREDHIEE
jgi:hypothetical protein